MKTLFIGALLVAFVINTPAQRANLQAATKSGAPSVGTQDTPFSVVQRDANSRVWQRTTYEQGSSGELVPHVQQYIELATGMHYKDPKTGEWLESSEVIEILPNGGAQAIHGQHQAYFPGDIYEGVIELVTADGRHLKSRPLGINYYDGTNSVLIAELKHSVGQLLPSGNQVIYTNAFTDFAADLVFTYRKGGFESDLVLREQPPSPEAFQLSSRNSRIELLTEFFDTPEPEQVPTDLVDPNGESGNSASSVATANGAQDNTLVFGGITMVQGKAFSVNSANAKGAAARGGGNQNHAGKKKENWLPVSKNWGKIDGRTFLIEGVPVQKLGEKMKSLPASKAQMGMSTVGSALHQVSTSRLLPSARIASQSTNTIQLTRAFLNDGPSVVLDYVAVNSTLTNFTFQGDTTYLVTGPVSLYGNTVIEGGTVVKFVQTNACALNVYSNLTCQTGPYRPAIFTSKDDNSVGETISGSTGAPVVDGENYYLFIFNGLPAELHDLRILYAYCGITKFTAPGANLSNIQFAHTAWPVWLLTSTANSSYGSLRNVLMTDVTGGAIEDTYIDIDVENLTVNGCVQFGYNDFSAHLSLTNCLLVGVQQMGDIPYTTNCVAIPNTNEVVFQTSGAGGCYLANNSPYRNVGTTNINSSLLAQIQQKTTYPPVIYSNYTISADTTLSPQAQRDTDTPDLGYHYHAIDYLVDNCWVTNATLTIAPATTVACYNESGLVVTDGSAIQSTGTPTAPIWFTRYSTVQEQSFNLPNTNASPGNGFCVNSFHSSTQPGGLFRFSKFSSPANGGYHLYHSAQWAYSNLLVQDCEFWNGQNNLAGNNDTTVNLKNNLFARSSITTGAGGYTNNSLVASNNLFWNMTVQIMDGANSNNWIFFNNSFDNVFIAGFSSQMTSNGYNAYLVNTNRLRPSGVGDIISTNSAAYQAGPLGYFYQATNSSLINAGSVTADIPGLYHYTTTTNEVKEGNSMVDVGYHYVAVDNSGAPIDSNGDGTPDYSEDSNGNGLSDGGEMLWGVGIVVQPTNRSVFLSSNIVFGVTASGVGQLYYQWYFNGAPISGGTSAVLYLTNVQMSASGNYSVIVSNFTGAVGSDLASLTVLAPPSIAVQPASQSVFTGDSVSMTVVPAGTAPFYYQWLFNGIALVNGTNNVSGAQSGTLFLSAVDATQAGSYSVAVSNLWGCVTSAPAVLTITCNPLLSGATISSNTFYFNARGSRGTTWNVYNSADLTNWSATGTLTLDKDTGFGSFSNNISNITNRFYKLNNGSCCSPAIGFVRIVVGPGTGTNNPGTNSLIANQLDAPTNTLDGLFNLGTNHAMPDGTSLPTGTVMSKWNGTAYLYYTWNGTNWGTNGGVTLAPGEGAFLANPTNTALTVTFVGLVRDGLSSMVISSNSNYQLLSAVLPVAGQLTTNWGFSPVTGNQVQFWNGAGYNIYTYINGVWNPTNPSVNIGQAFFLRTLATNIWQFRYPTCSNSIDIVTEPQSQSVTLSNNVVLSVTASSSLSLRYQWFHNGAAINNATNSTLSLTAVLAQDAGSYYVVVSNSAESVTSALAVLTVWGFSAPSGLQGWWQAESNTLDATALNPPGTVEGTLTYVQGEVGRAFYFSGSGGDVHVVPGSSLKMGADGAAFTVEGWIKPKVIDAYSPNGSIYSMIESDAGTGNMVFSLGGSINSVGDVYAAIQDTGGNYHTLISPGGTVTTNAYYHVAATFDPASGAGKLYVNGVLVVNTSFGSFTPLSFQDLYFGGGTCWWMNYRNGSLDELSIYGRALTATEILTIYNEGTLGKHPVALSIASQPVNQTVNTGDGVAFNVIVAGTSPLTYQWRFNGIPIPGATGSTLTNSGAQISDAGLYDVVIQNALGSITSAGALLTVLDSNTPPIIVQPPVTHGIPVSQNTSFSVQAVGKGLTYQWSHNGVAMSGKTSSTLTLNSAQTTDSGTYSVVVANAAGNAEADATLLVLQIQNFSTTVTFTLSGAQANTAYDLYTLPSLGSTKFRLFYCGSPGQTSFTCPKPNSFISFFDVGLSSDSDGDGLTDGYEALVSHSSLTQPDSDQDGLPDGWEAEWGLNPASAANSDGASGDPDNDGVNNNMAEFSLGTDPFRNESTSSARPELSVSVQNGAFKISRTGSTSGSLTVNYTVGGTAVYGTDYSLSPAPSSANYPFSVNIPSGASFVTITPSSTVLGKTLILALVPIALSDLPDPSTWNYVVNPYNDRASLDLTVSSVSITASDPLASQVGSWGSFTVTLPQPAGAGGVYVYFNPTGNAQSGVDYVAISSPVLVPASSSSTTIWVQPLNNSPFTGTKSVTLTPTSATGYSSGQINPASATVTIVGSASPSGIYPGTSHPMVTIAATDADARELTGDPNRSGTFTVTRSGASDTSHPLDVTFKVSGTATYGVDYAPFVSANTVTIPASATTATITITPVDDGIAETAETVILTVQPSETYDVGYPSNATVVIDDNSAPTYTVVATDPVAIQAPAYGQHVQSGSFTITRTGSILNPVSIQPNSGSVYYVRDGTAAFGTGSGGGAYTTSPSLNTSFTIQAGEFSKVITINPGDGNTVTGSGTIRLALHYTLNGSAVSSGPAIVTLYDNSQTAQEKVSVNASTPLATRSSGAKASFVFSRSDTGNLNGDVIVHFRMDGQASLGGDYTLSAPVARSLTPVGGTVFTVKIPSGQPATTVTLTPLALIGPPKGMESVIVSLLAYTGDPSDPGGYRMGKQWQAALRIRDSISISSSIMPDTDRDGIDDNAEVKGSPPTDALIPDGNGDGLPDGYTGNPTLDSNGDGITDGAELYLGLLPTDSDADSIFDLREVYRSTDPSATTSTGDTTVPTIQLTSPTSPKVIQLFP